MPSSVKNQTKCTFCSASLVEARYILIFLIEGMSSDLKMFNCNTRHMYKTIYLRFRI